ncbi:hypothetical protein CYMTET_45751, partial [Cymbomonas tetramitiformis]
DDLILKLFAKIERIENFVKSQSQGGAASLLPKRTRKGLSGHRVGSRPDPHTATEVSMVHASFTQPVSAVVAATTGNDAPSFFYSAPTDEFPGGIEMVPPPAGPRTIEMSAHSVGTLPGDAIGPVAA